MKDNDNFHVENDCLISKNGRLLTGLNKANIEIPNGVTIIGNYAFTGKTMLTSVVIPNSVRMLVSEVFSGCSSLKEITVLNTTPPEIQYNTFSAEAESKSVLKVPAEALEAYLRAENWMNFLYIVGLSKEEVDALGITTQHAGNAAHDGKAYRLDGTLAGKGHKGIIITNGKKIAVH